MTNQPFKPGDLVQYRGSGVVMYVILTSGTLSYCGWIGEGGAKSFGTYETQNLTAYTSGPQGRGPELKA